MFKDFEEGDHIEGFRGEGQLFGVHSDNREAGHATGVNGGEVFGALFVEIDGSDWHVREGGEERPKEGTAAAADIEEVCGREAAQDAEDALDAGEVCVGFEFVEAQTSVVPVGDAGGRVLKAPADEGGGEVGEIAVHGADSG